MPLCTTERISERYAKLNQASLTRKDGSTLNLYPSLLALLLRLSSIRGGAASEIARRTIEVLDQFERNEDQQHFILTIFETVDARTRATPEAFDTLSLTVLSDVCQNGVQTLSSVTGEGMELVEKAMTTLMQSYIVEQEPAKWKELFKEATNVAYMVKYMFREDLKMAKEMFTAQVGNPENYKKMPNPREVQQMMTTLIDFTLSAYGEVGIYDPKKLAELDFLNQPQLLVDLVMESNDRASRKAGKNQHMRMMTEVTTRWMEYMIDRKFPPLTPHHTQAFTVMMMVRCFEEYLGREARERNAKSKLKVQAFIAQMSTGEGKSIVIAMLAVFMVKMHNVTVHVLENNEGLMERDYKQQAPFYQAFGIASDKGKDGLANAEAKIVYCLKKQVRGCGGGIERVEARRSGEW